MMGSCMNLKSNSKRKYEDFAGGEKMDGRYRGNIIPINPKISKLPLRIYCQLPSLGSEYTMILYRH